MANRIPYGYKIVDGRAVIDTAKADQLKIYYQNFLSGESMASAARAANLPVSSSTFPHLFKRKEYAGTDYYPAIISPEYQRELIAEWQKRKNESPRKPPVLPKKGVRVYTEFRLVSSPEAPASAPARQASQGGQSHSGHATVSNDEPATTIKIQEDEGKSSCASAADSSLSTEKAIEHAIEQIAILYQRIRPKYRAVSRHSRQKNNQLNKKSSITTVTSSR